MKYILDSGMGTELEAREINIPDWKKSIWTANALIFNPDIVKNIHIENIEAGSNVIITNNSRKSQKNTAIGPPKKGPKAAKKYSAFVSSKSTLIS